jgi:hypothetical protein
MSKRKSVIREKLEVAVWFGKATVLGTILAGTYVIGRIVKKLR